MNFAGDQIYHIYNRGNDSQKIFPLKKNYEYFLGKINSEIKPVCHILAYCLMPNHYHLLVYVSENCDALKMIQNQPMLARKIGTMQSSYTQGINKQEKRTGSLFQQKSKAKYVDSNEYAANCLHYIHQNPWRAKLVSKWRNGNIHPFVLT